MKSALVTGAGGFVGSWLCRALVADGWQVHGTSIEASPLTASDAFRDVQWHFGDLASGTDVEVVRRIVDAAAPDAVFHLAGISFVPAAGDDPVAALGVNAGIGVRVLEAVRRAASRAVDMPRVLFVGSAEQYGRHEPDELPLSEISKLQPRTFYGVTKMAQEEYGFMYHRTHGIPVIATRSFNHSGAGHAPAFVLPALVDRVIAARREGRRSIPLGNTTPIRDYLHVSDVVAAYRLLVERGTPGEAYNVCSGAGVSVLELAHEVLAAAGFDADLVRDPALERSVDVPALVGSNAKLRAATGWTPLKSRSDIISDLLDAAS